MDVFEQLALRILGLISVVGITGAWPGLRCEADTIDSQVTGSGGGASIKGHPGSSRNTTTRCFILH
jgi:hypothetical protein